MITADSTLDDVAFAVCTALYRAEIDAVLTGGAAAVHYAPAVMQSYDADFILQFDVPRSAIVAALEVIGFSRHANGYFRHARSVFTVEFPVGPLAIGSDVLRSFATERRADEILQVLSPTDAVRDRFMAFFAWGDLAALKAALAVAWAIGDSFDLPAFERWAASESDRDASYPRERLALFLERYRAGS